VNVAVIISANAEWVAVREIYPDLKLVESPYGKSSKLKIDEWELALFHSGWGKVASAGMMQYVIDQYRPGAAEGRQGLHFYKGKIGRFRESYSLEEQAILKEKLGTYLQQMGYEF